MAKKKKENLNENVENVVLEEPTVEDVQDKAEEAPEITVDDLLKKLEQFKQNNLRLQADFDNFRKRNSNLATQARNNATADILLDVLEVVDNMDRAIDTIEEENSKAGVVMIKNQMLNVLKKYKVEEILALDEDFDPNFHNAVIQEDLPEKAGKVTMVLQKGYMFKDKVLRYATVKVAK